MGTAATHVNNATHRIELCFHGKDNTLYAGNDDICYAIYDFGELDEDCGTGDHDCRYRYNFPHWDFAQSLIDINEHGTDAYLTKYITAGNWQSQDHARYMRAGRSILMTIEALMGAFNVIKNGVGSGGSAYRTQDRCDWLRDHGNPRVSYTSHHMDGVAADIILDDPYDGYKIPEKCEVLPFAYQMIGNGETLHEGTATSVHIAKPGFNHTDAATHSWRCH